MDHNFRGQDDFEGEFPKEASELSIDDLLADAKAHLEADGAIEQEPSHYEPELPYAPDYGYEEAAEPQVYDQPYPQENLGFEQEAYAQAPYGYEQEPYAQAPYGYEQESYGEVPYRYQEEAYREAAYGDEEDQWEEEDEDVFDPGPMPKKPKSKRKKRIVPLFVKILLYVVLVGVASVGLGYGIWECARDVLAFGRSDDALSVVVKEGDTVEDIAQMLKEKGVIKYPWLFEMYCSFTDSEDTMDPGNYVLYYNYDYHALVNGMVKLSPNRVTVRVTIPEGYTAAQIFSLMEAKNVCSVKDLEDCAAEFEFDYWFLEEIPYGAANRLEGFLFPDTYEFYEDDDPERVLDKLLTNFDNKFTERAMEQLELLNENLASRWAAAGYDESYIAEHRFTIYELMTVASMIEKETAGVTESGNIASVIYNRLCKPADFPYLNIDATVVYALGGVDHPLTYDDLEIDSPYNTYKYTGLPAGPISNPGLSGIAAALNPSATDYYYYALDRETGFHHFSKTAREHEQFLEDQNHE